MSLYRSLFLMIALGIASRIIPHFPNFTALNAIALSGTCSLKSPWYSLTAILLIMLPTDVLFGFHDYVPFVYLSYGLSIFLGTQLKKPSFRAIFSSSLLFFVIVNFGVWSTGSLYPKSIEGLGTCYLAALPFLLNQFCGDLFFGAIILYGIPFLQKKQIQKGFSPVQK